MVRSESQLNRDRGRWTYLVVLACALWHIWAAGHYTVFDDEAFSCRRYTLPMREMIVALWHGAEPDPPLYYVAQNLCVRLLGVGPLELRALSIALFAAGLLMIRAAAAAWFDRTTAHVAMVICALHPAHLMLGFAARWYSAMFLAVTWLMWATAKLRSSIADANQANWPHARRRLVAWRVMLWGLAATAVCYVNYFGPVLVGLFWLVGLAANPRKWIHWLIAILMTGLLYAPWAPAFWRQLTSFPDISGGWRSAAATAARTGMALSTGSVASVQAWWVWGPMAMFAACAAALLVRYRRPVGGIALVVLGCIAAGAASRTMLDKYVLSFSGIACVLIAALLRRGLAESARDRRLAAMVATVALTIAWIGCGINLARGQSLASLRWHDPYPRVMQDLLNDRAAPPADQWVVGHPSAWYYFGLESLRSRAETGGALRIDPVAWRRLAVPGENTGKARVPLTAEAMLPRLALDSPDRILTVESSDFADSPAWKGLIKKLEAGYFVEQERTWLEDPDSALKDRIDPRFHHPRWRITVRFWRRIPSS